MTSILPPPTEKVIAPHGGMSQTWYEKLRAAFSSLDRVSSSFAQLGSTGQPLGTAALEDIGTSGDKVPLLNAASEWSGQQTFGGATLTYATNIAWNLDEAQTARVTLTGNATLDNPTNMKAIGTYILIVKQDGTGSRTLAFGSAYKWPGGIVPSLTPDANAVDILTFVCDDGVMRGVAAKGFA